MHNYKLLHLSVTIIVTEMMPWKMDCFSLVLHLFAMDCRPNCYMSIIKLVSDLERYI